MPSLLQELVETAAQGAREWAAVAAADRAALLRECMPSLQAASAEWVRMSCEAKGIDPNSALAGEEWISGPAVIMRHLRLYAETLEGKHAVEDLYRPEENCAQVYPSAYLDTFLFPGCKGEINFHADGIGSQRAVQQPQSLGEGGVAAVLGAGNINSIPPLDAIYLLLTRNLASIVKLNPVNDYLQRHYQRAFAPLMERGLVQFICGDHHVAAELIHNPLVSHVHLTGSEQTYDAVVWNGDTSKVEAAKYSGIKQLDKPVTAELGAVTPVFVVPGAWSRADLKWQARHIAGMLAHNTSFNCNAPKLLVTARHWKQREQFMTQLRAAMKELAPRRQWYPGVQQRWQAFADRYSQAEVFGDRQWMLIPDVALRVDEYACQVEAFCGILAETSVAAKHPEEFLRIAIPAVNQNVRGSLSCVILAPGHVQRSVLRLAIADLNYGAVAVNTWGGAVFGLGQTSWGAFPGHTATDIQSGNGEVHNCLLLEDVQKSILWAPFRPWMRPMYLPGHRRLASVGKAWVNFEAKPSLLRFLKLAIPAMFP
ncbi:MAG: aldehyde dehydrogenase family protein [Planctomycetes bacterium]|nr:aldehyde dehydrogenase family protein [Planctomycetota bacterium]